MSDIDSIGESPKSSGGRKLTIRELMHSGSVRFPQGRPPPNLYHYTDADALLSIVPSRTLRLTDTRFLNDAEEVLHGVKIVRAVLDGLPRHNALEHSARVEFIERAYLELAMGDVRFFTFCLCEQPNLLNQWRAYGGKSTPLAIGLDTMAMFRGEIKTPEPYYMLQCLYDDAEKVAFMTRNIRFIEGILRAENPPPGVSRDRIVKEALDAFRDIMGRCIQFKHSSFREEREWRLVVADFENGATPIKFRSGRFGVTPFVELKLEASEGPFKGRLPLTEIWAGPARYPDAAQSGLDAYMRAAGYSIPIHSSALPYRP